MKKTDLAIGLLMFWALTLISFLRLGESYATTVLDEIGFLVLLSIVTPKSQAVSMLFFVLISAAGAFAIALLIYGFRYLIYRFTKP